MTSAQLMSEDDLLAVGGAPIQLRHYRVLSFSLKQNPNFLLEPNQVAIADGINIEYSAKFAPLADNQSPGLYVGSMALKIAQDANRTVVLPYEIEIAVEGALQIDPVIPEAERTKALMTSGTAFLFGGIKEFVATTTSRAAHGTWYLPNLTFALASATKLKEVLTSLEQTAASGGSNEANKVALQLVQILQVARSMVDGEVKRELISRVNSLQERLGHAT